MLRLPPGCPETLEHALLHIKEIMDAEEEDGLNPDVEQIYHDAGIVLGILSNIIERKNDENENNQRGSGEEG